MVVFDCDITLNRLVESSFRSSSSCKLFTVWMKLSKFPRFHLRTGGRVFSFLAFSVVGLGAPILLWDDGFITFITALNSVFYSGKK